MPENNGVRNSLHNFKLQKRQQRAHANWLTERHGNTESISVEYANQAVSSCQSGGAATYLIIQNKRNQKVSGSSAKDLSSDTERPGVDPLMASRAGSNNVYFLFPGPSPDTDMEIISKEISSGRE
jgi:hypothetical protein